MREVNQAGLELIKKQENDNDPKAGYRCINGVVSYVPYIDPVGICTIGFGTIMYPDGRKVTMQDPPISEQQALALCQDELHEKSDSIERWAKSNGIIFNDNQFAALCSLAYNCGAGVITDRGRSMNSALLSQNSDTIKEAFLLYCKGRVKKFGIPRMVVLPGLLIRRKKEVQLYFS